MNELLRSNGYDAPSLETLELEVERGFEFSITGIPDEGDATVDGDWN